MGLAVSPMCPVVSVHLSKDECWEIYDYVLSMLKLGPIKHRPVAINMLVVELRCITCVLAGVWYGLLLLPRSFSLYVSDKTSGSPKTGLRSTYIKIAGH